MSTTTQNSKKDSNESHTWQVSVDKDSIFTNDDVINAYLKGKKEGRVESNQLYIDKLNENINKSATFTQRMLEFMIEHKLNPISAHLKIKSYDDFIILITLPEKQFISEDFLISYDFAASLEEEIIEDKYYNVMFMFSDREEEVFNTNLLVSDGFFMDYKMSSINA
ncbi:hypothetical protein [Algibacter sp. 2305UL17-15]|uniref:hypothetical protein n=1 Tax=Algibacter sp. 2305UL17-15 TaxID=3231268 RepID=UPI00345A17DF